MNAQFDDRLKAALAADGNGDDPFAPMEEESAFKQAMGLFHGRQKRLALLVVVVMTVWMIIAIYSAVQFFRVEETRDMIMFGLIFFFAAMAVSLMKVWSWMQMDKYTILREIKRLELQIAFLAQQRQGESES